MCESVQVTQCTGEYGKLRKEQQRPPLSTGKAEQMTDIQKCHCEQQAFHGLSQQANRAVSPKLPRPAMLGWWVLGEDGCAPT